VKNTVDKRALPGATLAYMGDAALETLVRERLILDGQTQSGKMNKLALSFVKATEQSRAVDLILPHLTEEEQAIYKRGRNAHGISAPKSAGTGEYRRATGFEALFGWLYLTEQEQRMRLLFDLAFPKERAATKDPKEGPRDEQPSAEAITKTEEETLLPDHGITV
jgi:ribonuclease-3 family protein